jgi:Ca2+-binding RTX toxin-like protein
VDATYRIGRARLGSITPHSPEVRLSRRAGVVGSVVALGVSSALAPGDGNDFFDGNAGDGDTVNGEDGDDSLFGGPGVADVCQQGTVVTIGWFASDASCEVLL